MKYDPDVNCAVLPGGRCARDSPCNTSFGVGKGKFFLVIFISLDSLVVYNR